MAKLTSKVSGFWVGWVSPTGRNPTNGDAIHEDVGLRDETANPTY